MFDENFKDIFLDDFVVYFLAKELKLEQIIGFGVDFDALNQELKTEVEQACYDFMRENEMLEMDFSGETTVADKYKDIVSAFEFPEYCCIIQEINNEDDSSAQRKIFKSGDRIIGLDYVDDRTSAVYEFDNAEKANEFAFYNLNIACNADSQELNSAPVADIEQEIKSAKRSVLVTEYVAGEEAYEAVQKIYILNDDWCEIGVEDEENVSKNAVLYPVALGI